MLKDANNQTSISRASRDAGFVAPIIGRKVHCDVFGFPGFPLIRKGETITREIAERALLMGRSFELTAATQLDA